MNQQFQILSEGVFQFDRDSKKIGLFLSDNHTFYLIGDALLNADSVILVDEEGSLFANLANCPVLENKLTNIKYSTLVVQLLKNLENVKTNQKRPVTCQIPCVFDKQLLQALTDFKHQLLGKYIISGTGERILNGNPSLQDLDSLQKYLRRLIKLNKVELNCHFLEIRNHLFFRVMNLINQILNINPTENGLKICQERFEYLCKTLEEKNNDLS